MSEWEATETPWARRTGGRDELPCYFCGGSTAKLSSGDRPDDPGRLEVYCENQECDAREVAILVLRNGSSAPDRADVRALREVDRPNDTPDPLDVMAGYMDNKNITRRRQNPDSLVVTVEAETES